MACSVCRRDDADAINARLAASESPLAIAQEIGLAKSIVYRHRAECIGEMVARSMLDREQELTANVEARFRAILHDTMELYATAVKNQDYRLAAFIINQRARHLSTEQKLFTAPPASGLCDECETLGYPKGWPELKVKILAVLEQHPAAKAAMIKSLDADEPQ
jgi:hypothetical protein